MSNQSSGSNESIKKRNKKSKDNDSDTPEQLTKEEQKIARFLRLNCPHRQGNLHGMKVDFFVANKLVDCLMESKWGPGKSSQQQTPKKQTSYLQNRQACIAFMQRLMNKQLFHRAVKVYKDQVETAGGSSSSSTGTPSLKKRKTNKENTTQSSNQTPSSSKDKDAPEPTPQQKDSQTKRKFKLEIHEDHVFIDGNEPYVWVYDPTSTKTYIIGLLLILGAIGVCLFPLWPSQVREGVYYVSLAGASFLGGILALAVFKYVLFGLIWAFTFGSVHFWLFPNLTEDVGFLESFVPVYKCSSSSSSSSSSSPPSVASKSTTSNETTTTNTSQETNENDKQENKTNVEEKLESIEANKEMTSSTISNKKSSNTPDLRASTKEISKSTLEINTVSNDSPSVRRRPSNKEDDGFELVDDDDLIKN